MPVRDDPGVDALRKFITARDAQLETLLAGPIDDAQAAQIVGIARDIEGYAMPRLSSQLSATTPRDCAIRPLNSSGCVTARSEAHTSELQSLMRISYTVFCLKKKKDITNSTT